jgi:hypothetical protein
MAGKKKATDDGGVNETKGTDEASNKKTAPRDLAAAVPQRVKPTKIPKLAKKNKPRLPRREKKALKKAEAAQRIPSGDRA